MLLMERDGRLHLKNDWREHEKETSETNPPVASIRHPLHYLRISKLSLVAASAIYPFSRVQMWHSLPMAEQGIPNWTPISDPCMLSASMPRSERLSCPRKHICQYCYTSVDQPPKRVDLNAARGERYSISACILT